MNPAFPAAFVNLARMLSGDCAARALNFGARYLKGLAAGAAPEPKPEEGAVLVIALLHCEMGTPLFISDELFDNWALGLGDVAECLACGYRHPAGVRSCHVCSGAVGPGGCWAARRRLMTGWN